MTSLKNKITKGLGRDSSDDSSTSGAEGYGEKYILRVSAGPSYDESTHQLVPVNSEDPTCFENEFMTTKVKVRIRGYNGLPRSSSSHSPYFDHPMHSKDQYSVGFSFVPKKDLDAVDAAWGNDFDHPIRDRLPPGFNYAFRIVKEFIDPAIEADAYADEPWMFTPALDGFFKFRIGEKLSLEEQKDIPHPAEHEPLEEGADGSGIEIRKSLGMPENSDKRRKFYMKADTRAAFNTFEKDRLYQADFFNPYIDFNKFALKLPGFSLKVIKYVNDKTHILRYVFKNRKSNEVYFVVHITLLFGDDVQVALREEDERSRNVSRAASVDGVRTDEEVTPQSQQSHGQQLEVPGQKKAPTRKQEEPAQDQRSPEKQAPVQEPAPTQEQVPEDKHTSAPEQSPNESQVPKEPVQHRPAPANQPLSKPDQDLQQILQDTASSSKVESIPITPKQGSVQG